MPKATSFIVDNIVLCPLKRNDVDRKQSNDVLVLLIMMLCPADTNTKKYTLKRVCIFLEAPPRFELGMKVLQTSALPLGYGAIFSFKTKSCRLGKILFLWSGRRDSNSRRSPWQGDALPLSHSRIFSFVSMVPPGGIEPPTRGFSVPCSTD